MSIFIKKMIDNLVDHRHTTFNQLPTDLKVHHILPRICIPEICRFRCVSTDARIMVAANPQLLTSHSILSNTPMLLYIYNRITRDAQNRVRSSLRITSVGLKGLEVRDMFSKNLDSHVHSIISCTSLVCFVSDNTIFVCNPISHQLIRVSKGQTEFKRGGGDIGMGYIPQRNEYSLIHLFSVEGKNFCEFYSITCGGGGESSAWWRAVGPLSLDNDAPFCWKWDATKVPISAEGFMFWMVKNMFQEKKIFAVDLAKLVLLQNANRDAAPPLDLGMKCFKTMDYPRQNRGVGHGLETQDMHMIELGGHLSLVDYSFPTGSVEIWKLLDCNNGIWVKKYAINCYSLRTLDIDDCLWAETEAGLMIYSRLGLYEWHTQENTCKKVGESNIKGKAEAWYIPKFFTLGSPQSL